MDMQGYEVVIDRTNGFNVTVPIAKNK